MSFVTSAMMVNKFVTFFGVDQVTFFGYDFVNRKEMQSQFSQEVPLEIECTPSCLVLA